MADWAFFLLMLVLLAASFMRWGWAGSFREPVPCMVIALNLSSLRRALQLEMSSTPGAALFTAQVGVTAYALYLLWQRVHPSKPDAA